MPPGRKTVFVAALPMLMLLIGLFVAGIGLKIVSVEEGSLHAPHWVMVVVGTIFFFGGASMLLGSRPVLRRACIGVMLTGFGLTAAWVSLFASADGFSGGVPLVPKAFNVGVARVLFGSGAILAGWMLWYLVAVDGKPKNREGRT